ncbi:MAG: hypothetical protein PHO04_02605 [Candidatus Pacebacteria bacterium]|nr:hypothetical protein [Candidatus Paceibacterota bacterium]
MFKKIFLSTFLTLIIFCTPVFASDLDKIEGNIANLEQFLTLKNNDAQKILKTVPDMLAIEWYSQIGYGNWDEDEDAISMTKVFTTKNMVKFLVVDYPLSVAYNVTKEIISLSRIILASDIPALIGKIENITVEKAVEYATNKLFQYEVRIGSGALVANYKTKEGGVATGQINYLISKKYIDDKNSEVAIKFYSPHALKVPPNAVSGKIGGIYISEEEIKPFIVTIKGVVEYKNFGYSWKGNTQITVEYPDHVPDFEFREESFFEEHIAKPVKNAIESLRRILGFGRDLLAGKSSEDEDLELIEDLSIEELTEIEESIEEVAKEDPTFAEKVAELNEQNKSSSDSSEPGIIRSYIDSLMSEEAFKNFLISIYNELMKRDSTLASENNQEQKQEQEQEQNKGKDKEGEISFCAFENQTPLRNSIILNEIAWMGSKQRSTDEWIELKNIGNTAINLKGYQLFNKNKNIKIEFDDLEIKPGGFLLLERTDDTSVPEVKADLIYKGAIANSDETLYLFNNKCGLEDMVEANPDWVAGDNKEKKSMERRPDLGWQTYSGDQIGTPRAENSKGNPINEKEEEEEYESGGGSTKPKIQCCSQENLGTPTRNTLILNEIAWMGTEASVNKEWIELKNIGNETINLKGYQLLNKKESIQIEFGDLEVEPGKFLLLERTDDTSVPEITADLIYKNALANSDESLRLFNDKCVLLDEVVADPNWPAGDNKEKKSMERRPDLTWQTYFGDSFGTPRAENSEGKPVEEEEDKDKDKDKEEEEEQVFYCPQTGLGTPTRNTLILNEIAWMGISAEHYAKEWIELKNIGNETINLKGYQLLNKKESIQIEFGDLEVEPGKFLLLEKTKDTIPGITADLVYKTGTLVNSDESLRLFNDKCVLLDEVIADPKWPAGDNENKRSMERRPDLGWQTYFGSSFGTPRAENSAGEPEEIDIEVLKEYCKVKGGEVKTIGTSSACHFKNGKICNLLDFYTGKCTQSEYAESLIVSEVSYELDQPKYNDGRRYIKLYNPLDKDIPSCQGNDCIYLTVFGFSEDIKFNTALSGITFKSKAYFQIDITDNGGDISLSEAILNNKDHLTVCLFDKDITGLSLEERKKAKIDCFGWEWHIDSDKKSYDKPYEYYQARGLYRYPSARTDLTPPVALLRKKAENGLYYDRNHNNIDIEAGIPSVYTIPSIENFKRESVNQDIELSWNFPDYVKDLIEAGEISYRVEYTENTGFNNEEDIKIIGPKLATGIQGSEIIGNIKEGVDYRFKVRILDNKGNISEDEDFLFYVYYDSFENHPYPSKEYDAERTNHAPCVGPQNDNPMVSKIQIDNLDSGVDRIPVIDEHGNFYLAGGHIIVSYDKNGILRWRQRFSGKGAESVFLTDTLYSLGENALIKYSHAGDVSKTWLFDGTAVCDNLILYNNHIYFERKLTSEESIISKMNIENGKINDLYSFKPKSAYDSISKMTIDTQTGNLYFIDLNKGLVRLSQQGEARIAEITGIIKAGSAIPAIPILVEDSVYVFLQNGNESVSWGAIKKDDIGNVELVLKKQGGKREGGKQEQEIFARTIFRLDNEFYLMCSRAGGKRFYKLNESEERWIWAGSASVIIDKDMLSAVVDKNNRVYFAGSDYIVGFEKDGDELRQIFSARTDSTSKVVIANGKAYQVSSYLIEAY